MTFWLKVQMLYHMNYRGLVGVKANKLGSSDKHPARLRASSPGRYGSHAGWEKEGELATMSLEFEFRQEETSPNVNKNRKTCESMHQGQ